MFPRVTIYGVKTVTLLIGIEKSNLALKNSLNSKTKTKSYNKELELELA